jgi:exosome complex component RRP45
VCEIVEPRVDRPNDGFLTFSVELSAMADYDFLYVGKQSEESQTIARIIDRTLRGSCAVDTEALCILSGKCVWSIRVDITVLNNDGNLIDSCYLAALLALLNFRRPEISIEGDQVKVHSLEARDPVRLSVHHVPICITFALFENGSILVADPTLEEEQLMNGRVVVAMNIHNEICLLDYPGGIPVTSHRFRNLPIMATDKVKVLSEFIERSLQEDVQRRKHDAMPQYAKTFYGKRRQEQAVNEDEGEEQILDTILGQNDPFADFLRRVGTSHVHSGDVHNDADVDDEEVADSDNDEMAHNNDVVGEQSRTQPAALVVTPTTPSTTIDAMGTISLKSNNAVEKSVPDDEMMVSAATGTIITDHRESEQVLLKAELLDEHLPFQLQIVQQQQGDDNGIADDVVKKKKKKRKKVNAET